MNVLQISTIVRDDPNDDLAHFIFTSVLVDGQPIVDYDHYVVATNLFDLCESIKRDGEFFIITCLCGDAGCAGIQEGVHVSSDSGKVQWNVKGWAPTQTYIFEREAYVDAIEAGVEELRQMTAQHKLEIVPRTNLYTLQQLSTP